MLLARDMEASYEKPTAAKSRGFDYSALQQDSLHFYYRLANDDIPLNVSFCIPLPVAAT